MKRYALKRDIVDGLLIGIVATAVSYCVGMYMDWIDKLDWLEVFAVFTSYWCTWLCVKERRINYPLGAISSAAYAVLFWRSDLVASAALNAYLAPYLVYGWIRWRDDADTRPITRVAYKMYPLYALVAGAGYLGAVVVVNAFDGAMAWTDAFILAGTVLAQLLLDNKKLENWIVWAAVNVLAIYTYFNIGLPLVGFQYILFLGNTVYGYWVWKHEKNYLAVEPVTPTTRRCATTMCMNTVEDDTYCTDCDNKTVQEAEPA